MESNSFCTSWAVISAAVFVEIDAWEGNPLHREVKAGEDLSQSHLHHHEMVIPDVQGIELMSRLEADTACFAASQ